MKRFLKIIILCLIFNLTNIYATNNPYKQISSLGFTNCTWYAWDQVYKKLGIALPGWGNADTWLTYAKNAGYEVGTTPKAKSIVVWHWGNYGHVGYVERVSGDKIYVWDSDRTCIDEEYPPYKECMEKSVDQTSAEACYKSAKTIACENNSTYWISPGDLIGYIYLDKIPEKTTPILTTPTEVKKSNNASLNSLIIDGKDFEFNKDVFEYELTLNKIDKITINATAEDKKAKVDLEKTQTLNVGLNIVEIKVTAEDGTTNTYVLKIKLNDNNANLSNLSIDGIDFEFNKDVLEYEIKVNNDKININGTSESTYAKIDGIGSYDLNNGLNMIEIKVTAEDNTSKIYKINIYKEEKENIKKQSLNNKNIIIYIILIAALIIIVSTIAILIIKKCKKNK